MAQVELSVLPPRVDFVDADEFSMTRIPTGGKNVRLASEYQRSTPETESYVLRYHHCDKMHHFVNDTCY